MALEGPLKDLHIQDVFQLLDLGRKSGVLRVTSELRQTAGTVCFERGGVVAAAWRSSDVTRRTPLFRPRSSSWKTSWMCRSLSGPSSATGQPTDAAKMCCRSRADRARVRAWAAYGPAGSSWTTRSQACTAWSNCRCRARAAPSW